MEPVGLQLSGGSLGLVAQPTEAACAADPETSGPAAALYNTEYRLLRLVQSLPGLMLVSLAVHYSLMPKVITPLLALLVWLVSLPRGASLITFVCASDLVNTAVKWALQRPRPRWCVVL